MLFFYVFDRKKHFELKMQNNNKKQDFPKISSGLIFDLLRYLSVPLVLCICVEKNLPVSKKTKVTTEIIYQEFLGGPLRYMVCLL